MVKYSTFRANCGREESVPQFNVMDVKQHREMVGHAIEPCGIELSRMKTLAGGNPARKFSPYLAAG